MTSVFFSFFFLHLSPLLAQDNVIGEHNSSSPSYYGYQFGSSRSDYSSSIWTDNNGNTFVTGNTNSSSLFQNQLTSGAQDIFVSKHDSSNGSLVWGIQFGSFLPDSGIDISSLRNEDMTTDIFITGYTTGKLFERMNSTLSYVNFNSRHPNTEVTLCPGQRFIASTNSYYWGTSSSMYAQLELRNPFGKVIATSSAYICWGETLVYDYPPDEPCATLELNCYSVPSCIATAALVITEPNSTLIDGFLSRHNSETGEMLWGVQFGSSSCDVPYAVDISPWDSGVYVVGGTRGSLYSTQIGSEDVFVGKFNSSNGQLIWGYQHGNPYVCYASSVACDEYGDVYVLGDCTSSLFSFFKPPWNSTGSIITMKMSSSGTLIWGNQFGRAEDFGLAIAIGVDESIFVSGYNKQSPDFFLYKLNSSTGEKIWNIKEDKKFGWSMSVVNSSVFVASTILRENKNKFHLSRYDGDTGMKLWGMNYASVPTAYAPSSTIRASVSINQNNLLRVSGSVSSNLFVKKSYGEVDFIIFAPNICPAGYHSAEYTSPCEICPSNTYSSAASHKCIACPHGFLSNPGSLSCNIECHGGYYCDHSICFHTDQYLFYYLFGLIVPVYFLTLILLGLSWVSFEFAYTSLVSTFDFLSDILYLTTTFFYNETLFYASILLLFPAFFPLLSDLCLKIYENKNSYRLLHPPFFLVSRCANYSVIWVFIHLLWSIFMIPYVIVSLVFGYYLIQSKLLTLPFYEKLWHDINFSNAFPSGNIDTSMANRREKLLNLRLLNRAVVTEIWFEAVPQIIIQSVNNVRMKSFGLVPQISLVSSVLLIVNSYYRIFYFNVVHRIPLSEIPAHLKTPLSPLIKLKSKLAQPSAAVKYQTNPLLAPTDYEELNQETSSSLDNESTPILVHFERGETGIVFKNRRVNFESGGVEMSVFLISNDCPSYVAGVRRGYVVESINGNALVDLQSPVFESNYSEEPCDVVFRPPTNPYVIVRLESQIQAFEDIGLVVSHCKSCFHDVGYFLIDSVDPHSICYESGVRARARIMFINRQTFIPLMHFELFSSGDSLETFLLTSFRKGHEEGQDQSLAIVFKNRQPDDWLDSWSTDQEILNNHLRSVFFLIVTSKNGVPYIGRIPFFFTEVLDNFPTFCLFLCAWFLVIIIQLCWIPLWMVWYSLTIPFTLPWTLFRSLHQLHLPFQLSQYALMVMTALVARTWKYAYIHDSVPGLTVWKFWNIAYVLLLVTSCSGGLVFRPYAGSYLLLLWIGSIFAFCRVWFGTNSLY